MKTKTVTFKCLKTAKKSMGGGKRLKFKKKYISEDKKLGKYVEEKKEHNPENVQNLLDLWNKMKEKKE